MCPPPSDDPHALKAQLRRIGAAKAEAARRDVEAWLALSLEERLDRTVRHCDAMLRLSPPDRTAEDDEAEVWARVNRHLQRHAPADR